MIAEVFGALEVVSGVFLALYPVYSKRLSERFQQLIQLTICVACSASLACRTDQAQLLWFGLAYACITAATFFFPMLIVVVTAVTTATALMEDVVAWYISLPFATILALGVFGFPDFVRHWQVWLLPGLAATLATDGLAELEVSGVPSVWFFVGLYALGSLLQLNKLKRNFDELQKEAEAYKENHYKLFEEGFRGGPSSEVLAACKGDQEQIERVLFGAGLY